VALALGLAVSLLILCVNIPDFVCLLVHGSLCN
jgi:hypothetical protein